MPPFSIIDTRKVYDGVFNIYVPIAIGVFLLFTLLIIGAVLVYRRNSAASRRHEANLLEGSYAVLLTCVAAFLLYVTFSHEHTDTAAAHERPAVTVNVIGSRWEWTFDYPGHGITQRSGAVGHQPLVVPVGVPVRLRISSQDVIHSFWVPELKFKRDAIPGHPNVVTLDFDRTGHFSASCAEFCGLLHAYMVFTVDAVTPKRFHAWLASGGRTRT